MREESHLDDMRSAIRGDFERLARRRGSQDLMQVRREPEVALEAGVGVASQDEIEPSPRDQRSWLARLLSR